MTLPDSMMELLDHGCDGEPRWITLGALDAQAAANLVRAIAVEAEHRGYGRSLPLERMMRDARMFAIGGGTLEMMRNLIADRLLPTRANWRG